MILEEVSFVAHGRIRRVDEPNVSDVSAILR
jgi:hypothetical protein